MLFQLINNDDPTKEYSTIEIPKQNIILSDSLGRFIIFVVENSPAVHLWTCWFVSSVVVTEILAQNYDHGTRCFSFDNATWMPQQINDYCSQHLYRFYDDGDKEQITYFCGLDASLYLFICIAIGYFAGNIVQNIRLDSHWWQWFFKIVKFPCNLTPERIDYVKRALKQQEVPVLFSFILMHIFLLL